MIANNRKGNRNRLIKIGIFIFLVAAVGIAYQQGWLSRLNLESLKSNQSWLKTQMDQSPFVFRTVFFFIYVLTTAFSLPGAAVLTLAAGFIFGLVEGVILVSFASTIGATLAFLLSRFFLRDWIQSKFKERLKTLEEGFKKEGTFYLFSLRLVPLFPFFLVNLLMGLTPIRAWNFYWVSQLGMLPGTIAYINAGTELSEIESLSGILSPSVLIAFAILGILPLISKRLLEFFKSRRIYGKTKRPKKFDYNLIVIGAGSAGLVTAYIGAALKAKVALIEKHRMGGDCLNTGCVPSKSLIKSAKVQHLLSKARHYGIEAESKGVHFEEVMDRVHKIIQKVEPHDSVERYSKLGVECIQGEAKIKSPFEVQVGDRVLTTKTIVIATGARPLVPKILGLDRISYLTSDTVWSLRKLPERLLVLGGGPIGCELAQAFQRLGSQVTLVEMAPRLLIREDIDVSENIEKVFRSEGMHVLVRHKALEFLKAPDEKRTLKCEGPNGPTELDFDQVILALGRSPNTKGFGLEELGIDLSSKGTIEHDAYLRTKYPNILVCGDVAGPYQFTHTAAHQAWYAAVNGLLQPLKKFKADYRVIPWCTFTEPEVARVGLNEQEAEEQKIEFEVTHYGLDDLDRAMADSEDEGFVKVITKKGSDKILGATIVGTHAGDMITEFILAMKHGLGLNKILGTIHIYPTFPEANKYAAGLWKQAHKPERILNWVKKFHEWRRG
ncbi:MAG: FAD-dependent oxidoreductase [Bacteriovoracia bacterium]